MTELAHRNDVATAGFGQLAPAASGFAGVRALTPQRLSGNDHFDRMGKWLELFMATEQVAQVLARTAFVPEPMRGQPENIAAAMMKSLELGIDPLDGLSCIHVVKGKIGFSAEFMRRRIIEAGHEIVIDEATDSRCKIRGRRAGSSEWQTVVFTEDQARKAKINLGDYPADKLVARASSRLCRRVFPDVLAGTTIVDELEDFNGEVVEGTTTATTGTAQRKRQPRKTAQPKPAAPQTSASDIDELLDDDGDEAQATDEPKAPENKPENIPAEPDQADLLDDDDNVVTGDPIAKAQLQKLSILRQREGYADTDEGRQDWFQWVQVNIGRLVSTNKDLTKAEASVLIDVLESAQEQDGAQ